MSACKQAGRYASNQTSQNRKLAQILLPTIVHQPPCVRAQRPSAPAVNPHLTTMLLVPVLDCPERESD